MTALRRFTFQAFACGNEVQIADDDGEKAERAGRAVQEEALRIQAKYSRYSPASIVSEINSAAGQRPVAVDAETAALLNYAAACFEESRGLFDISSGVLRRAWNFAVPRLPEPKELDPLLALVGWNKVRWDGRNIFLPLRGMELDFGGFGKEYAVDRAAAVCAELGIQSALINFGGDVRVLSPAGAAAEWKVGITHPRAPGSVLGWVELASGSIATSGDYERFIEVGGRRYSHLLDPRSGYPVHGLQAVSVVGESCLVSGALSTIAMLAGAEAGQKILKTAGVPFVIVDPAGKITAHPAALLHTSAGRRVGNSSAPAFFIHEG
jgi:thiamine biosynthesis lipoprotein